VSKNVLRDLTKSHIKISESSYKYYLGREVELKEQLDNTPKIFKNKRVKLQKQIKEMQSKSDKHFNNYLDDISSLYDLTQDGEEGNKSE
jgi:uncharacterized phage infection (PIP) family protein YhgE